MNPILELDLNMLDFRTAVALFGVAFTLLFTYLDGKVQRAPKVEKSRATNRATLALQYIMLLLFVSCSLLSVGKRDQVWFLILVAIFINTLLLSRHSQHSFIISATVIVVTSSIITSIVIVHGTSVIGTDQWRDFILTTAIVEDQNVERASALGGGYYAPFPVIAILTASISMVTTLDVFRSFFIFTLISSISIALSIFIIVRKLTGSNTAAVISFFLLLSTPRTALWEMLPSMFAVGLALIYLFLFISSIKEREKGWLVISPFLIFVATASHVIGALLVVSTPLGLLLMKLAKNACGLDSPIIQKRLLNSMVVSLAYWTFTVGLYEILLRFKKIQDITLVTRYLPLYTQTSWIYALSWAIPVSLASAYFIREWRPQRHYQFNNGVLISSSIIGGILIVAAFLVVARVAEMTDIQRYLGLMGYTLIFFPASFFAYKLLGKSKFTASLIILILGVNLWVGSTSMNWAPDIYPIYESTRGRDYDTALFLIDKLPSAVYLIMPKSVGSPLYVLSIYHGIKVGFLYAYTPGTKYICIMGDKYVRAVLMHIADDPNYIKLLAGGNPIPVEPPVPRNQLNPIIRGKMLVLLFIDTRLLLSPVERLCEVPYVNILYDSPPYKLLTYTGPLSSNEK
jgi:hypothetical protein